MPKPLPPKKWPSPEDLLRALVEAKERHGCRNLERLDRVAYFDTAGQIRTNAKLAKVLQTNSKKREDPHDS